MSAALFSFTMNQAGAEPDDVVQKEFTVGGAGAESIILGDQDFQVVDIRTIHFSVCMPSD